MPARESKLSGAAQGEATAAVLRRTPYRPYGTSTYRRELCVRCEPGRAVGELVDDFHHFRSIVDHDGARVTRARGEVLRHPWRTCAEAVRPLERLARMPLSPSLRAAAKYTRWRDQCTHLFDAASLAVVGAARGWRERSYSIAVPDLVEGRTRATLARDGAPLLDWRFESGALRGDAPFGGRSLASGFADWAEAELDAELSLAALLLQRAVVISQGRRMDLESAENALSLSTTPSGQCHTYQPGTVQRASRVIGSIRNWNSAEELRAEIGARAPGAEEKLP
jgi:hypothetical protein